MILLRFVSAAGGKYQFVWRLMDLVVNWNVTD